MLHTCHRSCGSATTGSATPYHQTVQTRRPRQIRVCAQADDQAPSTSKPQVGAGLKAVWYGAEVFGKLVAAARGGSSGAASAGNQQTQGSGLSREALLASLRADYNVSYFVSGAGDMVAYAQDCEFADPFVSFKGTARFKQNVSNLGGMMRDIKLDVYDWQEDGDEVRTRWRFSCLLDLPWRPRLAAAGGTTHVLSGGQVVRHVEAWDVEPGKVVQQLLLPSTKVPSNAWETFLLAAADGDAAGMWFVLTPTLVRACAPAAALVLLSHVVLGQGLGDVLGDAGTALEVTAGGLFAVACVTEVVKFAQGMQGGETGAGGRF